MQIQTWFRTRAGKIKNIQDMKNSIYILLTLLFVMASCADESRDNTVVKPKPIQNAQFKPLSGGGVIYYDIPDDESIHFVKAEYALNTGKVITRASSFYSDSIVIDGFDDSEEHAVKLYCVNFEGVTSDPYTLKIRTEGSPLAEILNTFQISPSFSSAKLSWENETGLWIQVVLEITTKDKTVVQTEYSMLEGMNEMWIRNLANEEYLFAAYLKDRYGNLSAKVNLGSFIPLVDYKLDKSTWDHIPNDELPEGMENADLLFQEGRITKFWDDMIDDVMENNLNYFYSSKGFPFSYFIDLGRSVKISKVKVWQRESNWQIQPYYYNGQNVKTFEIWISNDKINWERVRRATILKPANQTTAYEEAREGHEFLIYEDDPRFTPEFRYLEFRGIETFGMGDQYATLSEITLFGIEEKDF